MYIADTLLTVLWHILPTLSWLTIDQRLTDTSTDTLSTVDQHSTDTWSIYPPILGRYINWYVNRHSPDTEPIYQPMWRLTPPIRQDTRCQTFTNQMWLLGIFFRLILLSNLEMNHMDAPKSFRVWYFQKAWEISCQLRRVWARYEIVRPLTKSWDPWAEMVFLKADLDGTIFALVYCAQQACITTSRQIVLCKLDPQHSFDTLWTSYM